MTYVCKSSTDLNQIKARLKLGFSDVELHLVELDCNDKGISAIYDLALNTEINILGIHMPILTDYGLEGILNIKKRNVYDNIFKVANNLGILYNRPVYIVMHLHMSLKQLSDLGVLTKLYDKLSTYLFKYQYVKIGIENLPLLDIKDGKIICYSNDSNNTHSFVESYRDKYNTNRVFYLLDICHLIVDYNFKTDLNSKLNISTEFLSVYDYILIEIKEKIKYIDVIHLSNGLNYGLNKNEHGAIFKTDYDILLLKNIIDSIKNNKILTVLELIEEDYINCNNLKYMYDYLLERK